MTAVQRFLTRGLRGGEAARKLEQEVLAAGAEAVPELIAALTSGNDRAFLPVWRILRRMRDPELIERLVHVMAPAMDYRVRIVVFDVLGRSRDVRAKEPLVRALTWRSGRRLAARALGYLGDGSVVPKLHETLTSLLPSSDRSEATDAIYGWLESLAEEGDPRPVMDAISISEAMARLEDFRATSMALYLTGLGVAHSSGFPQASEIRGEAVRALAVMPVPHVMEAVEMALSDPDEDVARAAVRVAWWFRSAAACRILQAHLRVGEDVLTDVVKASLDDILRSRSHTVGGVSAVVDWGELCAQLDPRFCYRNGEPLDITKLFDEQCVQDGGPAARQELELISGRDFGLDPNSTVAAEPSAAERAWAWWEGLDPAPEPGLLVRWARVVGAPPDS